MASKRSLAGDRKNQEPHGGARSRPPSGRWNRAEGRHLAGIAAPSEPVSSWAMASVSTTATPFGKTFRPFFHCRYPRPTVKPAHLRAWDFSAGSSAATASRTHPGWRRGQASRLC